MRYNPDMIAKYLSVTLIALMIVVVVFVIVVPSETRSICRNFQYFVFLDQKATQDSYSVELLNGVRDIHVSRFAIGNMETSKPLDVKAGDAFMLTSPFATDIKSGETFSYTVFVSYDIVNGISNNKDTATCTGRVQ